MTADIKPILRTNAPTLPCPSCGKPALWAADNPSRPFCSERCKLIDLGAWASESHRIPGDDLPPAGDDDF